jgi:hypothetical protein
LRNICAILWSVDAVKMHAKEEREGRILHAFFHSTISKLFSIKAYGMGFLIGLTLSHYFTCSKPVPGIPMSYVVFGMSNELRWKDHSRQK